MEVNNYYNLNKKNGFNLIELMISMAVGSVIMLALAHSVMSIHRASANTQVNGAFASLVNDVELVLKSADLCGQAIVDSSGVNTLQFDPPPGSSEYSVSASYFKIGSEIILKADSATGPTPPGYLRDLQIDTFNLSKIDGLSPTPTTYIHPTSGLSLPANKHTVRVNLTSTRKRGTLSGQSISRSWLVDITTDQATNRIVRCASRGNNTAYRAIAERSALALHATRCRETAPNFRFQPNTCPDTDGNGRCDGQESKAVNKHPIYGTPSWNNWYPNRSSGTAPLGSSADEGRCLVDIESNTSNETPDQIFALLNKTAADDYKEGIGCRTDNGWYLSGCFRADDGSGDSDIIMLKTANAEYCITNDHTQPHTDDAAFTTEKVTLTLICMKFE